MDCTFNSFLRLGSLGDLKQGSDRVTVSNMLGVPTRWEGKDDGCDKWDSTIWLFNDCLQVNFNSEMRVDEFLLLFRSYNAPDQPFVKSLSPLNFVDIDPLSLTKFDEFVGFLQNQKISFTQETDAVGKSLVRTSDAVVSKFSRILYSEESKKAEKAIRSSSTYLVSITAGKAALGSQPRF